MISECPIWKFYLTNLVRAYSLGSTGYTTFPSPIYQLSEDHVVQTLYHLVTPPFFLPWAWISHWTSAAVCNTKFILICCLARVISPTKKTHLSTPFCLYKLMCIIPIGECSISIKIPLLILRALPSSLVGRATQVSIYLLGGGTNR